MSFDPEKNILTSKISSQETHEYENAEDEKALSAETQSEVKEVDIESLKLALDNARDDYARVLQRRESSINKLKQILGNVDAGQDVDSDIMRTAYNASLAQYREAQLAHIDQLPEVQKKEALAELKAFELQESCNLVESHSKAKAETLGGKCGEMIQKTADWYKKVPLKYKIAVSAALFAGGLATGVGAAAGVLGAAAMGKRVLGATVAGVGATGWMEARAQKKEQAHIGESIENFKNLSIEEQMTQLKGFDDVSFQKIDALFQDKLADRKRRVIVGMGAAAGIMALGDIGKVFGVSEAAAAEIPATEMGATEHIPSESVEVQPIESSTPVQNMSQKEMFIAQDVENLRTQQELAKSIAEKMGMDSNNIQASFRGGVPVEINGQPVPAEMLSQQPPVDVAEKIQSSMQQAPENTQAPRNADSLASRLNAMKSASHFSEGTGSVAQHVETQPIPQEITNSVPTQTHEIPKTQGGLAERLNAMKKVFPSESGATDAVAKSAESMQSVTHSVTEQPLSDGESSVVEHANPKMEKPHVAQSSVATVEKTPTGIMSLAQEKAVISEMVKDAQFNNSVAAEIQKLYGLPAKNIGRMPMGLLEGNNQVVQEQVERVKNLAIKYLGNEVGSPRQNMTIGTYFTRIAAHAANKKIPLEKIFS